MTDQKTDFVKGFVYTLMIAPVVFSLGVFGYVNWQANTPEAKKAAAEQAARDKKEAEEEAARAERQRREEVAARVKAEGDTEEARRQLMKGVEQSFDNDGILLMQGYKDEWSDSGVMYIVGKIKVTRPYRSLRVYFKCKDAEGNVTESPWAITNGLSAGEMWRFKALVHDEDACKTYSFDRVEGF